MGTCTDEAERISNGKIREAAGKDLEVADYFRLNKEDALKIIEDIKKSVTNWRSVANKYQLPKSEQEFMAKVFERFL